MSILFFFLLAQPVLRPGWPVPILSESEYGYWGGPKAYDVDFDGEKEILFAAGTAESGGILYAFNQDGTFPPGWPIEVGEPPLFCAQSPVVGDLDGDHIPEIAVGTFGMSWGTGGIYAFELNGMPVQNFPISAPPNLDVMFPLTLALITPDSVPEILVAFSHYSGSPSTDRIGILNPMTGEFLDGWPIFLQWVDSRLILFQENMLSVYFKYDSNYVGTWWSDGTPVDGWPVFIEGFPGLSMPGVADINRDSLPELICPWFNISGLELISYMYIFSPDGNILPGFPLEFQNYQFHSPPAFADIDQDGFPEIIQDGSLATFVINHDGTYSSIFTNFSQFDGEPAVADVDGDNILEVVLGRSNYIENDSSIVGAFRINSTQPQGWPVTVIGQPTGTPLIEDLDGDGLLEMVVFTQDLPWVRPDTGWLYLFDLPAPFDSARVPWGQYAHDLWNSGIYGFNPPVSVAEKPPLQIPTTYQVVYRNGIPELILTLSHPQTLQLNLYDVTGRMLWRNVSRYPSGTHRLRLPGNIPSGVHILKLRGDQKQALKVIKLR